MKILLLLILICVSFVTFSQVPNYVPIDDIAGWWPFNGNANDESGNGYNGTVNGATLTTDRFGNANSAYDFDGSGQEIVINDVNTLLDGSDELAISCWINLDVVIPSSGGSGAGLIPIVSKWTTDGANPNSSYLLYLTDDFIGYE